MFGIRRWLSASAVNKPIIKPANSTTTGMFYELISENQQKYDKHLLMARVGDFYEFYFEQADKVSQLLGIRIAIGKYRGREHRFCGFPSYKMADYTRKLIDMGYSVAKYEQYSTQQSNGSQTILRKVDRIFSPGNLIEDDLISEESDSQFMMAMKFITNGADERKVAFSCIDMCSGNFYSDTVHADQLEHLLASVPLSQIIISSDVDSNDDSLSEYRRLKSIGAVVESVNADVFCDKKADEYLQLLFGKLNNCEMKRSIDEKQTIGAILTHVLESHGGKLPILSLPVKFDRHRLQIDIETCNSLELLCGMKNNKSKKGSLFSVLDHTVTPLGKKELMSRIRNPYSLKPVIETQLDITEELYHNENLLQKSIEHLKRYFKHDSLRALQNLKMGSGGLWHLGVVRDAIYGHSKLLKLFGNQKSDIISKIDVVQGSYEKNDMTHMLDLANALNSLMPESETELPKKFEPPGMLNHDTNKDLQEIKSKYDTIQSSKVSLESDLKQRYLDGMNANISLEFKKSLGGAYVEIETTKQNHEVLSKNHDLICVQSLGETRKMQVKRYQNAEWTKLASKIKDAETLYENVETEVFSHICDTVASYQDEFRRISKLAESLDVSCSLAIASKQYGFTRPHIVDEPIMEITEGFHPNFTSYNLQAANFKKNDCILNIDGSPMAVVTGANAAGKSMFLRQNALIVIMAHLGSFVPAKSAKIGLCDKVFSRLTGSDDIINNQSGFMVEMNEAGRIVRNVTKRSFVIIDEIGRATSFDDGISLAYGIANHLNNSKKCRTLFATHYRDLALEFQKSNVKCLKSLVHKRKSQCGKEVPSFTYKFTDGVSEDSFGFHIAELAGLPADVIRDASAFRQQLRSK